jgi:hypothetical protein
MVTINVLQGADKSVADEPSVARMLHQVIWLVSKKSIRYLRKVITRRYAVGVTLLHQKKHLYQQVALFKNT